MYDVSLEEFQTKAQADREHYNAICSWHLQAWFTAGVNLPYNPNATYINVDFSDPVYPDYKKPVEVTDECPRGWEYDWSTTPDEEKIIDYLKKVVKFARSLGYKVEKNYNDDFNVEVTLPIGKSDSGKNATVTVRYYTSREAVCTKKVVGTKVVPAHTTPERIEEIVEWDCQKIALTA